VNVVRDDTFQSSAITSIACTPFIKGRRCTEVPTGNNALLDCRLSAINYPVEFYSTGAEQEISRILYEELQKKFDPAVDDYDRGLFVFKRLARDNPHNTLRSLASAFARERGVEYVMIGILENYIAREGSAAGIERPASVSFSLKLLHVPTGSVVFEGSFDETQQPLSENVLNALVFFKRGARWLTAGELAREGIMDILDEMQ
jgi:hypothetical protein